MGQTLPPLLRQLLLCLLVLPRLGVCADTAPAPLDAQATVAMEHFKEVSKLQLDSTRDLLQKDLQALGARLDAQDKRYEDLTKRLDSQNSHIDQGLSVLGTALTILGVVLAVAGLASAIIGHISVRRQVENGVKRWFEGNTAEVEERLQTLQQKHDEAHAQAEAAISEYRSKLDELAIEATEFMQKRMLDLDADMGRQIPAWVEKALTVSATAKGSEEATFSYWNKRAFSAFTEQNFQRAAEYWSEAIKTADASNSQIAAALFNKATALDRLNQPEAELAAYDELIRRFGNDSAEGIREHVAMAILNKGITLDQQNQPEAELAAYDELIRRFGNDPDEVIRERVAKAMLNKGITLGQLNQPEAELATYDELIRHFGNDSAEGIRERVAKAMYNKGVKLGRQSRRDAELATYEELIWRFGNSKTESIREQVANAMLNKGVKLGQESQQEAALATYDELIRRFGSDTAEHTRQAVAFAHNGKGFTLLCRAKLHWSDTTARSADLQQARQHLSEALAGYRGEDNGVVLGNQAYCAHLLAEPSNLVRPTLKQALELGEEKVYKGTLDDLAIHPVPEKDEPFRALLEEVWSEVQTEKSH